MTAALNDCQGTEFHSCRFVIVPSIAFYYLPMKSLTAVSASIIIVYRGNYLVVCMYMHKRTTVSLSIPSASLFADSRP